MPVVTIQVKREGSGPGRGSITDEEKAALIAGVGQLLFNVLHKPLNATFVVVEEIELGSWGKGDLPMRENRRLQAPAALTLQPRASVNFSPIKGYGNE